MLCQILVAGREVVLVSDAYHGALVAQNGYIRMGHIYGNFHIIVGLYDLAGLGVDFHNAGAILIMYLAVIGSGALRPQTQSERSSLSGVVLIVCAVILVPVVSYLAINSYLRYRAQTRRRKRRKSRRRSQ